MPKVLGKRKGKGKRKKGKGKKKKGKNKALVVPPPLHLLTSLYKEMITAITTLYELRAAARKKRIEGWLITSEITELKNDNALYMDYLNDNIEDIERAIRNLMKLIQKIKDAIAKAVAEQMEKLQKRLEEYEARTAELEKELESIRNQLLEFESMMIELARLLARIQELLKEIEAAKFDAMLKIRHLTNQFLSERGRLHNHLEEQLFDLIKKCRTYLMPILWNFMQNLMRDNACLRWKLARTDEKNLELAEKRQERMQKRKLLALEKPYWNIQWAFHKMCQIENMPRVKKTGRNAYEAQVSATGFADIGTGIGDKEYETIDAVSRLLPSTQLGKDFNVYLVRRLTAAQEARERAKREEKRAERRFLKQIKEKADAMKEEEPEPFQQESNISIGDNDEDEELDDEEDSNEEEEEEEEEENEDEEEEEDSEEHDENDLEDENDN